MNEVEVIRKSRRFLQKKGLFNQSVSRLFTDSHSTLTSENDLKPFQRFTVDMKDFVVHPDLVGQLADGETLIAVETKGESDLLKGLAQAELYQVAFHGTLLAADSGKLTTAFVDYARRKGVGVLAVGDEVKLAHPPLLTMPQRDAYRFVERQLSSVVELTSGNTFTLNLPTHYLVWSIFLESDETYTIDPKKPLWGSYPMPEKTWKGALRGARKLGLVTGAGTELALTPVGAAVKDILPDLKTWSKTHEIIKKASNKMTLAAEQPAAAGALRLLLLRDPIIELLIQGLELFQERRASFVDLAKACDSLDHARAPIFFLQPSATANLSDDKGRIDWTKAEGLDFRSSSFYQYKSILKHAGILTATTKLGGSSTKGYDPSADIWELA
ncbi:MAG: hypothetical protein P1V97_26385 [Planctomycetota bacterium]|nr:hypothetical protein [Planctomycetota bacterium]